MKKQLISQALESHLLELVSMSDQIYDFAEPGIDSVQQAFNRISESKRI